MELPQKFLDEMKDIVPDFKGFVSSFSQPPTKAFRVNEVKIGREKLLAAMGGREKVPYADGCYYLCGDEKWGNHPFHHAGLMYVQEPSAMTPTDAYEISGGLALDMCAAPGGKTIALANKVDRLVSNEVNPARAAVLKGNVERMGLKNVAVVSCFPKDLEKLGEVFDTILLDVPCSGEGMFRKDETAVKEWSEAHSMSCAVRQRAIISSADKLLKRGGTLIYSTCTFSRRENEDVLEYFLKERDYELIEPKREAQAVTVYLSDPHMRRFYPHIACGEGQFFAAMKKRNGGEKRISDKVKFVSDGEVNDFLMSTIGYCPPYCRQGDVFYIPAVTLKLENVVSDGVRIGKKTGKTLRPDHFFFSAYGSEMFGFEPDRVQLEKYLHGEELEGDRNGYGVVRVLGAPLGGVRGAGGRYKNLYPKGLRI